MNERFAIKQDPSIPTNWGIVWETSGTQGGFYSEEYARKDALAQGGEEIESDEAKCWEY